MIDQFSVAGQAAVVTGGTKGIGRAIAEQFVADGADVAICARTEEDVDEAVAALNEGDGGDAVGRACDVRDRADVEALVDAAAAEFGTVDCLVNNAGASFMAGFEDISENGWESVVDVNLTGTYNCTQAAREHLVDGGGTVINVASVAGQQGSPYMSHYGAAKAAIINLTSTLGYEWASDGVRVNCIAPGYVATPGVASQMGVEPGEIDRDDIDRNVGLSEEIADVAQFLASDASSFLVGETVTARGVPDIEETPDL
ncbi:SDR family NAD(P)-dependent oxidoreductase [Halosimplex amylolyticum]|uniref:SDR family NAD(P)-dependent oxidoreductase n=1 Tax=Halosimplex amylolyticum TaxID=3396616 RepID=UPI003F56DCA5